MKAVVAAFNQEKALVEALSMITNLRMELFEALLSIHTYHPYASLAHHPGQPQEEHRAPDVEEASQENALHPPKLDHLPLPGVHLLLHPRLLHRRALHKLGQGRSAGRHLHYPGRQ